MDHAPPGEPNPLILSRLPGGGKLPPPHKRPLFAVIAADGRGHFIQVVNKIVSTGLGNMRRDRATIEALHSAFPWIESSYAMLATAYFTCVI